MNPLSTTLACLGLALTCSAQWTWVERSPATSPSGRKDQAMAYDAARGRVVLFGGSAGGDETWEWDGTTWSHRRPRVSPSARHRAAMVYDSARGCCVLFGGVSAGSETWEWDGSDWKQIKSVASPSPRYDHRMAYDSARGRTVLFGGYSGGSKFGDTWEWDGQSWTQSMPATSPPARHLHAMAYDSVRGNTVMFGGATGPGSYFADTWLWNGTDWTLAKPSASPPKRDRTAMVYDSARDRMVLFDGWNGSTHFADTWEWDGMTWREIQTPTSPPAREDHQMAYDSARGRVVMFGGRPHFSSSKRFRGTWEYFVRTSASYVAFGKGCASTTLPAVLSATTPPKIDTTFTLRVSNLGPFSPGILLFGFSDTTWNGVPLPLDLGFLGMQGCNLLVSWDLQLGFFPNSGTWELPLTLPNDPTSEGLTFYNQAWVIDRQANAFGVGTSNGGKGVIGY